MNSLARVPRDSAAVIDEVGGERSFRRRLMEMGLVPGIKVRVTNIAPLGDPMEIEVRNTRLSVRLHEAALLRVRA